MSFRGGNRGARGGNNSRGSFRGGRGNFQQGPPDEITGMGSFLHDCEGELIPYFNAPIFLENKSQIGKVDEILGPLNEVYFTVKLSEGVQAKSFNKDDKVFIGTDKLLPLDRFLPKPKAAAGKSKPTGMQGKIEKRGGGRGGRGGGRGGFTRGGARGGGFSRGGSRGGSGNRGGRGRGRGH